MRKHDGEIAHRWIVLTEPDGDPPQVVVVNLTSRSPDSDTTVVLNVGDHPFVKRETVVYYADARFMEARAIEAYANTPGNRFHADCSVALLQQLRDGLRKSRFTPKKIKAYCSHHFGQSQNA